MNVLAAAKPWHYWLSYVLVGSVLVGIIATAVGYYIKVVSNKYPRQ